MCRGQVGRGVEQVDLEAQAGEWCAKFVAGISDESTLLISTGLKRRQHLVERRGQLADLIAAIDVDPTRKILTQRHRLGCRRDRRDRCRETLGNERPKTARYGDTQQRPQQDSASQPGQSGLNVLYVSGNLYGDPTIWTGLSSGHPPSLAVDLDGLQSRLAG